MGGSVSLSSQGSGKGATFILLLPFERLSPPDVDHTAGLSETLTKTRSEDNLAKIFDGANQKVHLALTSGPTSDALAALVRTWGEVYVTDFPADTPPHDADLRTLHADIDAAAKHPDAATRKQCMFVLESKVAVELHKRGCSALSRVPLLIVGSHRDNKDVKAIGAWAHAVLLNRPLKLSVFMRKAYCVMNERPHEVAKASEADASTPADTESAIGAEGGSKRRILLVEDHLVNQKVVLAMVNKIMGKNNVEIEIANDGHEGLAKATADSKCAFDLIFMDIQMPGMDGLEAKKQFSKVLSVVTVQGKKL